MQSIFTILTSAVVSLIMAFGLPFIQTQQPENLGQSIPNVVALFETSLAQGVTSTATSMTLVSGTDKAGTSLSGTYGFIIDEGSANEEFVSCSATATALTGCTRGLSVVDGSTAVTSLQKVHRRGASVKITDFPIVGILARMLNGTVTIPNRLSYASHPDFSGTIASTSLVTRKYADDLALTGTLAVNADTTTRGIGEVATTAEINAGTSLGGTGAYLWVNPNFLSLSSYSSQLLSEGQELALSETAGGIYGTPSSTNKFLTQWAASSSSAFVPVVHTYTASTSWTKPAGLKYIVVELCGGGGAGATRTSGGAGGYAKKMIVGTSLNATEQVTVASIASASYFRSASFLKATGGTAAVTDQPGTPGVGTGGDINAQGQGGTSVTDPGTGDVGGPAGGSSFCAGGGRGGTGNGSGGTGGDGMFGSGGGGGGDDNTSNGAGGAGSKGFIIITEHYI